MKIAYICIWDKKKEKTWSGTTYSLFESLKKYIDINDFDVNYNKLELFIVFIKKSFQKLINKYAFNLNGSKFIQRKINKICTINNKDIVLQIGDLGTCNNDSYIYQDLSVESLLYFKKNKPDAFKYSGYNDLSNEKIISKKLKHQQNIYNNCKGIFTMSKWLKNNLINYSGIPKNKVHYVGAGANVKIENIKNYKKNGRRILFVGRDFFRKGGDLTYEAFKVLKERYISDAELYIAGPKKWPLNNKIDGVKFLGDLSYDELSYYFNMCDIFCLPSRFEAYGIVFVEALIYGLPCIGRNDFAMKEFISDGVNGYLVDTETPEELALKMNQLLKNKQITLNVINNRNYYIDKYSWETVAKRMIQIIKEDSLEEGI